ncbi:universal stress protein [Hyalangium versicolor]|uniref:universal stress protein n=1 Tax=Hyalangium versicolor TaxID=2861190 RepID=UPI001CD000B8|nr:universal stress protein [Hyalangium versicolor]
MAGASHLDLGPTVTPHPFLKKLLYATQKGRGLTRLLVATDFSMCADLALARALRLPVAEGGSLTLFHAARPVAGAGAPGDLLLEGRCLSRVAGAARRRLRAREPMEVKEELRAGDVVEEVSAVARQQEVELVVVGRPHAVRSHEWTHRGAAVRGMVRRVDAPLLVVGVHPSRTYQRPLVAVDLSEDSRRALELALRLCPPPTVVNVLHVPEPCLTQGLWHAGMTSREHWLAVRQELETAARKALSRFLAPYREAGRECEICIRCSEPLEEAMLAEAADLGADLLAMGMHSSMEQPHPGPRLAEQMVMRADCDVLVAKAHPE